MSEKVMRHRIADFLNVGTAELPQFVLMGTGFVTLDENPSAQVDKVAYINNRAQSASITGYDNVFPFDSHLIAGEQAIDKLYAIGRDQEVGSSAQLQMVRVDLFDGDADTARPARLFDVAVEISSISGEGASVVHVAGNLHQVGDLVQGDFNMTTKAFTAAA